MKKTSAEAFRAIACATLLIVSGAIAAQAQPAIGKAFEPATIGPGSVSTATFTITNESGLPVTDLAFTDNLPAAVTLADPAMAFTSCAEATLTADDGGSTITLADGILGAFASCTVTVNVTSSTPGDHTNPVIALTSSAGTSRSVPEDLTVDSNRPGFSKSFSPSSVDRGERSTLTFTIDNTLSQSPAILLRFNDSLPPGLVVADPANVSNTCIEAPYTGGVLSAQPGSNVISLMLGGGANLAAVAAGATCTVSVDVIANGTGTLDNLSGELTSSAGFGSVSSGKAAAALVAAVTPLAITKDFTDDPAPPGTIATLEFTIDNFDRNFPATGVAFTDDLTTLVPALPGLAFDSLLANDCGGSVSGVGTTTISFSGGTLAPEATCTIRAALSIPGDATPGEYDNTTSAVTGTVDGSPVVGNAATETLFAEPIPVLTKEFLEVGTLLPDPIVNQGDNVVMRFTLTNTSATSSATDVAFLDELTTFLPFPPLVTLPPTPDPPCGAGSSLALYFPDVDRAGISLTAGSLAPAGTAGDSCTFDVTLTIPPGFAPGTYVNTTGAPTATVDGATRTGRPASDELTVVAAPRLTKSFTDDPVAPGGTVTLEFTLAHPADAATPAADIGFTDDLAAMVPPLAGLSANLPASPDPPCGAGSSLTGSAGDTLLTFAGGTLAPGESCTFSVTLNVPVAAATANYGNATSLVTATVQGLAATSPGAADDLAVAELGFTKEFVDDPVIPGDTTTLRFTIENLSTTVDATNIFFTDALSEVLPGASDLTAVAPLPTTPCGTASTITGTTFLIMTGGNLLAGESCSFDITVQVPADAPNGDFLNTTSNMAATLGGGSNVAIDPATDTLTVDSRLLELAKEFTDDPVAPGGAATLRFTLTNLDAARTASSIAFTDDLGAALTGLEATGLPFAACGGTVEAVPDASTIAFSGGSLAAGAQCQFDVVVSIPVSAASGIFTNTTSEATGRVGGLAVTGDPASDDLQLAPAVEFTKSFDGPSTVAGAPVLTFTLSNPGSAAVSGLRFIDDLGAMIPGAVAANLPLADVCGAGSTVSGTSLIIFEGGSLPPSGGQCSFDVELSIPETTPAGSYPNTTSNLTSSGIDVAEAATDELEILASLDFSKAFAEATGLGGTAVLTFSISNPGPTAITGLAFTDDLDAMLPGAVAASLPLDDVCGAGSTLTGTSIITLSGGSLAGGATCIFDVDVLVPASATAGGYVNTTSELSSSAGPAALAATASLVVLGAIPTLQPWGVLLMAGLLALVGAWLLAFRRF